MTISGRQFSYLFPLFEVDPSLTFYCVKGGIQINGLGSTDIDNQAEFQNSTTLGGLNLELHQRISKHYGRVEKLNEATKEARKNPDVWRFEANVAEKVIAEWLKEHPSVTIIKV